MWRDGLRALLAAQSDFEVVGEATDSRAILAQALQHRPDLVLCDAVMGESALWQVLELRERGSDMRVVVFGSPSQTGSLPEALLREVSAILPKNSPTEALFSSIRRVDRGEISIRAVVAEPMAKSPAKPGPLSRRERQLVGLIALGFRNREIADKLFISEQTVKNHLHNIFDKTGIKDRLELALYAIYHRIYE